jgi:hypothetical protein
MGLGRLRGGGLSVASCCRGTGHGVSVVRRRFPRLGGALQRWSGGTFQSRSEAWGIPARRLQSCSSIEAFAFAEQAGSSASHEVFSPSAPAHRAALSGGTTRRTIPLRLWAGVFHFHRKCWTNGGTCQPALAVFRNSSTSASKRAPGLDVARCGSCTTAFLPAMFRYPL